jgi:hypothetical protein
MLSPLADKSGQCLYAGNPNIHSVPADEKSGVVRLRKKSVVLCYTSTDRILAANFVYIGQNLAILYNWHYSGKWI